MDLYKNYSNSYAMFYIKREWSIFLTFFSGKIKSKVLSNTQNSFHNHIFFTSTAAELKKKKKQFTTCEG